MKLSKQEVNNLPILIPVEYNKKKYPGWISCDIAELPGHFGVEQLKIKGKFSLHTEYAYKKRSFDSDILLNLDQIKAAHKNNVPQLWKNRLWAQQFAEFIHNLIQNNHPEIIEIHPPFEDYCETMTEFVETYSIFENLILSHYPNTKLLIENRSGTLYRGADFLVSDCDDLIALLEVVDKKGLALRLVVDFLQLFTAAGGIRNIDRLKLENIFNKLNDVRNQICGFHLWGKKVSKSGRLISHAGDLNTSFEHAKGLKQFFLKKLRVLFDDDKPRYFVPEVNSRTEDMISILNDLKDSGFEFQSNMSS